MLKALLFLSLAVATYKILTDKKKPVEHEIVYLIEQFDNIEDLDEYIVWREVLHQRSKKVQRAVYEARKHQIKIWNRYLL